MYGQEEIVGSIKKIIGQDVPVFSHRMPDNFFGKCVVVRMIAFNEEIEEGTFAINVYAPNTVRIFSGREDKSHPDEETLDSICNQITKGLKDAWGDGYNCWITSATLFDEEGLNMHFYSFRLTIQIEKFYD